MNKQHIVAVVLTSISLQSLAMVPFRPMPVRPAPMVVPSRGVLRMPVAAQRARVATTVPSREFAGKSRRQVITVASVGAIAGGVVNLACRNPEWHPNQEAITHMTDWMTHYQHAPSPGFFALSGACALLAGLWTHCVTPEAICNSARKKLKEVHGHPVAYHAVHKQAPEALWATVSSQYATSPYPLVQAFEHVIASRDTLVNVQAKLARVKETLKKRRDIPQLAQECEQMTQETSSLMFGFDTTMIDLKKCPDWHKQFKAKNLVETKEAAERNATANQINATANMINAFNRGRH